MLSLTRPSGSKVFVGDKPDRTVVTVKSVNHETRIVEFEVSCPGYPKQITRLTPRNTYSIGPGTYMKLLDITNEHSAKVGFSGPREVRIERDDR